MIFCHKHIYCGCGLELPMKAILMDSSADLSGFMRKPVFRILYAKTKAQISCAVTTNFGATL